MNSKPKIEHIMLTTNILWVASWAFAAWQFGWAVATLVLIIEAWWESRQVINEIKRGETRNLW